MVNPNVFTVPAELQQVLSKYKVLAAEYVYRPLSEAEAQDWSNALCLDKVGTRSAASCCTAFFWMQPLLTTLWQHADAAARQVGPGSSGGPGVGAR